MDDPWSSGPSWSAPGKTVRSNLDLDGVRSYTPSPSPTFAVADPWGVPAAPETSLDPPRRESPPRGVVESDRASWNTADSGWGNQATDEGFASEGKGGIWKLNSPGPVESDLEARLPPGSHEEELVLPTQPSSASVTPSQHSPTVSPETSQVLSTPTSPATLPDTPPPKPFTSPFVSPGPSNPQSPSFGEDGFGGFSGGFEDTSTSYSRDFHDTGDYEGFGESSRRNVTGIVGNGDPWGGDAGGWKPELDSKLPTFEVQDVEDAEEETGEWGLSRRSVPVTQERTPAEDEWEEAQRRIRFKQDRVVCSTGVKQKKVG
jgi:hypothetical protein